MVNWVNLDKIMANRDFIWLDNDEIQGLVQIEDLPRVIEECNLDKLVTIVFEAQRNIMDKIERKTYFKDGRIEKEIIYTNNDLNKAIDHIDPLNIFGRIIINHKMMELYNNEHND